MRLGMNNFSAKDVINKLEPYDIEKIFKHLIEEKEAKKIVNLIIKERKKSEIDTQMLVKIIETSKRKKNYRIHSSTKVFQVLKFL